MQISYFYASDFPSKLKLLQTRQTSRKNKKQPKAEIGYD